MLKIPTVLYSISLIFLFGNAVLAESSALFENRIDRLRMELRKESMLSINRSSTECHFLTLVDKDPGCATAGARIFVERSLRRLNKAVSPELPEPININEQLSHLTFKKVLPSSKALVLARFTTIANEAAHGAQFDSPNLRGLLIEDMPKVLAFLEEILLKIRI